jgi:hypothetical protein
VIERLGLREAVAWQIRVETLAELPPPPDPATHAGLGAPISPGLEGPATRPLVDLVTARAVAVLPTLTRWVAPLVRSGGHLITFKGSKAEEEIRGWQEDPGPWDLAEVLPTGIPGLTLVAVRKK